MRTLAILPVKRFDRAKQRLRQGVADDQVSELVKTMFDDVLQAVRRSSKLDQIVVVTSEPSARLIAREHEAAVIDDDEQGHNAAVKRGIAHALATGADRALLVPGDCPLLDPDELDDLISFPVRPPSALVVPDRHGTGTNGLLLTPPDAIEPSFGPDSCPRHLRIAKAASVSAEVVNVPSLALDIDTPDDLAALTRTQC
ncbi:MAG: 2-phospho-L-lactate guanylyltransferase [Solirubrobacterales bacterium]|nr:2-phospho-L-lactate guanylyltransferase [Solirubrobacterales bacterium]